MDFGAPKCRLAGLAGGAAEDDDDDEPEVRVAGGLGPELEETDDEAGGSGSGLRTMWRRRMVHLRMERKRPIGKEHLKSERR